MTARPWMLAATVLLVLPLVLDAQKPTKPPKPGNPANPAIAYQSNRKNGYIDLMVMDADARNQTRLVQGGDNLAPAWSPDGDWIAFSRFFTSSPGVYMVRPDGTGLCQIVGTSQESSPGVAWSPAPAADGAYKIVYVDGTTSTGGNRLFAVSAVCGATDNQALTQAGEWGYPAWSENGRLAASFRRDIYVFDVIDTLGTITLENQLNLTSTGPLSDVGVPSWTPDGTELLVSGRELLVSTDADLWVISADTPGIASQLTHTPESPEWRVTWSPDRMTIAFGDAFSGDLYTADISQPWAVGTPELLLDSRYNVRSPSWRPAP